MIDRRADRMRVRMLRVPECRRCAAGQGCGAGVFSRLFGRRETVLELPDLAGVSAGEIVQVGVEAHALGRAARRVYGFPLLAFVAAALSVTVLTGLEPGSPVGDAAALLAGLAAAVAAFRVSVRGLVRSLAPRVRETPAACSGQTAGPA